MRRQAIYFLISSTLLACGDPTAQLVLISGHPEDVDISSTTDITTSLSEGLSDSIGATSATISTGSMSDSLSMDSDPTTTGVGGGGGCGDNTVDIGEDCDDGPDNGSGQQCKLDCTLNTCGDGDIGPGESCDDGPMNGPSQACSNTCQVAVCGDGDVGPGEECDNGAMNGDTEGCVLAQRERDRWVG